MMNHLIFYGVLFMTLLAMMVNANMAPSSPEPGTVWTTGKEYDITWEEDNTEPTMNASWKKFRIDLMTGEDLDQVVLTNIADNVKGKDMKFKYTVPEVTPHAPIYFLMFTSDDGEFAWSTRFAIVGQDGKQQVPENAIQPGGEKIPWGVGKLVSKGESSTASSEDGEIIAESVSSASASVKNNSVLPSASSSVESHQNVNSAALASPSQSSAQPVIASSFSASSSAHKADASASAKEYMSDAGSLHLSSFIIVGAFILSVTRLFLF